MNGVAYDSEDQPHHDEREYRQHTRAMDDAFELLRGHFDGLVILGTFTLEDGKTATLSRQDGNWFAINGVVDYFLKKRRESAHFEARDKHESENP